MYVVIFLTDGVKQIKLLFKNYKCVLNFGAKIACIFDCKYIREGTSVRLIIFYNDYVK